MKSISFDNFLTLTIVLVSWILVLFLLTAKTKNYRSNVILALFFLVNAQDSSILIGSHLLYTKFPGLGILLNSTVFLKMPLLFIYLLSVIYSALRFKKYTQMTPTLYRIKAIAKIN